MRLFFAVPIPASKIFHDLYTELSSLSRELKPVRPDLVHVTLKFLGEVPIRVEDLSSSAESILPDLDPFTMEVAGSGAFPDWRRPSVLWLSVTEEEKMADIAGKLSHVLQRDHGIQPDKRPFRSHLTVARIRRNGRIDNRKARSFLERSVENFKTEIYSIQVGGFRLISSELTPQGPVYTRVADFNFKP